MAQLKLIWDTTISDELNFHVLKPKIIDLAVSIGRVFGLDEFGLAYEVMSDAEFFILAGHAAMIRQPAGLAHGAGAFLTNWKKADDMEGLQKGGSNELRGLILDAFPDRLLAPMKVNKSLRTRTTQDIMIALQERHGTLSKLDLDFLMVQLKKPCPPELAPDAFIADWQASLDDLAQAGQPISQLMATGYLQQCFGPEYVDCWRAFVREFPLVADQTVARLCAAVITFSRGELQLLNAHTLIGVNQVTVLQEQVKGLQQELQAFAAKQWTPAAAAVPAAPAPSKRGKRGATTTKGAVGKHAKSSQTPFAFQPFCWSHGPCKHLGTGCGDKGAGHKKDATWQNQMGSDWKAYYDLRGWSTISP